MTRFEMGFYFWKQKVVESTSAFCIDKNGEELIFVIFHGELYGK